SSANLLGFLASEPDAWFQQGAGSGVDAERVEALIAERNAARKARDFARGDAIRQELADMGVTIEDGADGTRWRLS
ncbi:MAG TPA: cysteine--tRNA ligase, partial [Tahibacter sp.]|nr:cysteine--tRNA ligase [Tahibacter sp.]